MKEERNYLDEKTEGLEEAQNDLAARQTDLDERERNLSMWEDELVDRQEAIDKLQAELEVKNACSSLAQGYASGNEDPLDPRDKHPGELMFFGKKLLSSVTPGN